MKTNIVKYSLLFILVLNLFGCEDYLDRYPLSSPSSSTFLKTTEEMDLAINGAYRSMMSYYIRLNLPLEFCSDCFADMAYDRNDANWAAYRTGSVDAANGLLRTFWESWYISIQRCNFIIENVDRLNEGEDFEKAAQIVAEAKVIRAYFYCHLTESFGDVPYLTQTLPTEDYYTLTRTSKEEIVNGLLTDLEDAASELPEKYDSSSDQGRATKDLALGLKGRIALYNEKWSEAANAYSRVIASGSYMLDDDFNNLFLEDMQPASPEIMYMHQYKQGVATTFIPFYIRNRNAPGASAYVPTQSLVDSYLCEDGLPIDESPLYDPEHPFEHRDPRLNYTLIVPGSTFEGVQYETHRDSTEVWDYNTTPPTRITNLNILNASSVSGYNYRKYAVMTPPSTWQNSEMGVIVMRYAEVLLSYAEAKVEANDIDQSVYDAINLVRARVNMPNVEPGKSQAELRKIIRMERTCEFALEGLRLYDIRRWKIAEKVLNGPSYGRVMKGQLANAPKIDESGIADYSTVSNVSEMAIIENRSFTSPKNYLFPIPSIELQVNPGLGQNPGY